MVGPKDNPTVEPIDYPVNVVAMMYEKIKPKPIFESIIDQIRSQIAKGILKPGDLLPPERQLSEMIGVNRHSLRTALKVMEYIGVLESKSGVGTIVRSVAQDALVQEFTKLAEFSPRKLLFELIEFRKALEPHIAELAAQRATDEDLACIEKAIIDLENELKGNRPRTDADERLHIALARATHNSTFVKLTEPMNSMLEEFRERSLGVPRRRQELLKEHKMIYEAVKDRKPKEAKEAMAYHLRSVEAMLSSVNEDESPQ